LDFEVCFLTDGSCFQVVDGFPEGVRICATPASEGATVELSFPVEPVLQRLDELDDARLLASKAKLADAKGKVRGGGSGGSRKETNPFE
jgi:hypothetical protein